MTLCQRSPGLRGHDNEYADTGNDRPYSDAEKKLAKNKLVYFRQLLP